MQNRKIVMLATASDTTNILFNGLDLEIDKVIMEQRQSAWGLLRRRLKRLGVPTVFGQVLFRLLIVPYISASSRRRQYEIKNQFHLDSGCIPPDRIIQVDSVNDIKTCELLRELNPGVVLIKGTRILSRNLLESVPAKFVNLHTGITPRYRGVYGAYWALVEHDPEQCGVTVHLVDAGIDTGQVLAQECIVPTKSDNIQTYPLLQFAVGLPLLRDCVTQLIHEQVLTRKPTQGVSKLWMHPTLWQYVWHRVKDKVK